MKDYYDILGLPRNASQEDIKRSYRILAHQFHPDKEGGNEKRFKELNEAYRVLSGATTKADYDAKHDAGLPKDEDEFVAPKKTSSSDTQINGSSPIVNFLAKGGWVLVLIVVIAIAGLISRPTNTPTATNSTNSALQNTDAAQVSADTIDPFPMQSTACNTQGCPQYDWYDNHNVAMAYRCYPGSSCTAQEWAYAIYGNSNDPRGETLKDQAGVVNGTVSAQYPAGKCVTESGVQICDLSHSTTGNTGTNRTVKMQGGEIICLDLATGNTTDVSGDTIAINTDPQVCATDYGSVYIDPSITVAKHFGGIQTGSSYTVPVFYAKCIWTYNGGNGNIPYIQAGGSLGPDSSFYNVHAFCQNGSNEVDILTTST